MLTLHRIVVGRPCSPLVRTLLPLQEAQVCSLVGELRSHILYGVAKKKKNYIGLSYVSITTWYNSVLF